MAKQEMNPKFVEKCSFVIKDVPVFFAKIYADYMDEYEGKKRFKLSAVLEPDLASKMESSGFNIKEDEDGNNIIDVIRNYSLKDGTIMPPPTIVFEDGSVYSKEANGAIGNGSVCDLHVSAKYVKVGKIIHLPCYLNKVVLKTLIPYEGKESQSTDDVFGE